MRAERDPTRHLVLAALGLAVVIRLLTLGLYPLTDTTEARYAEVARKMVELGDWVTPWYDYGVPFWAKPPLSTWVTAASFRLFGLNEFAARLPHFLLAVAIAWLVWDWLRGRDRRQALLGVCMLCGAILFIVSSGAVMTDMALVLGTTMAMRGLWLSMFGPTERRGQESWLAFVGLAIGLLAKGPVALVLTGVPFAAWAIATRNIGFARRTIPWLKGGALTLALAVPWYFVAEGATPGFLRYFLVGEHWQRFTNPGWPGDRYGNAHQFARGTIVPFAAFAFLPWTVLLPLLALGRRAVKQLPLPSAERSLRVYLLCWALAPCVFFAPARNIIWTYALPGLPAAAMLAAAWLSQDRRLRLVNTTVALGTLATVLVLTSILVLRERDFSWKSTKELVLAVEAAAPGQELLFVDTLPYSASFYSRGRARRLANLAELHGIAASKTVLVGLSAQQFEALDETQRSRFRLQGRYGRYVLLCAAPGSEAAPLPASARFGAADCFAPPAEDVRLRQAL